MVIANVHDSKLVESPQRNAFWSKGYFADGGYKGELIEKTV